MPRLTLARGRLLRREGDIPRATQLLTHARELFHASGHLALELEATIELARATLDSDQLETAEKRLDGVIRAAARSRLRPLLCRARLARAGAAMARGDSERALEQIDRARDLATEFDGVRMLRASHELRELLDVGSAADP